MDADIVVRLEGVGRLDPGPRHVALDAAAGGIDRARGLAGAVAGLAFRFVIGRLGLGVLVRIVAGAAVEGFATPGIASAAIHRNRLEAAARPGR